MTKIHRTLKFKQSGWLKDILVLIKTKEKMLPNSFEKYFFKLMNTSTFGKTMGNLRKRINVRLVNNAGDCRKHENKPSFVSQKYLVKRLSLFMKLN